MPDQCNGWAVGDVLAPLGQEKVNAKQFIARLLDSYRFDMCIFVEEEQDELDIWYLLLWHWVASPEYK